MEALEVITDWENRERGVEAKEILLQLKSFKFLLLLVIFDKILSCTKSLSDQLQSRSIDMAKTADLVCATISILKELRTDCKWEQVFKYVQDVAMLYNIPIEIARPQLSRQQPKKYISRIVMETTGSRETSTSSERLKVSVYFPILDAMLSELNRRFADKNLEYMKAIQA